MSTGHRTRSERVAALNLPPGKWARALKLLRQSDTMVRISLCLFACFLIWAATGGWQPPFSFRRGQVPSRDIVARVTFSRPDPEKTKALEELRIREALCVYQHDRGPLQELRNSLMSDLLQVTRATSFEQLDKAVWERFLPPSRITEISAMLTPRKPEDSAEPELAPSDSQAGASADGKTGSATEKSDPKKDGDSKSATFVKNKSAGAAEAKTSPTSKTVFQKLREALDGESTLKEVEKAIAAAFESMEDSGTLSRLQHQLDKGSHTEILVRSADGAQQPTLVANVQIAQILPKLESELHTALQQVSVANDDLELLVALLHQWIQQQGIPSTLVLDDEATKQQYEQLLATLETATYEYRRGARLVSATTTLKAPQIQLLRLEHNQMLEQMTTWQAASYGGAKFGMYLALYLLAACWIYIHRPQLLKEMRQYTLLLASVVATVVLAWFVAQDGWWAELVPTLLFAMTSAVAYRRDLALSLTTVVALVVTLTLGQGLAEFVVLAATSSVAVLMMSSVRTRTTLILVGTISGAVAMLTTLAVGLLVGQEGSDGEVLSSLSPSWLLLPHLLQVALLQAFYAFLSGFIMTGLLPFVERLFAIQTDLSLLELGNGTHRLLQELSRRAPGTYNHSINVASLAESAAEAIGAHGLLARVGAYFHDIGKMLEPQYFVENQGAGDNRHESLVPAMSTLVIIAHVKDGADLARKHHLPQAIIDFIEQHHGTTLVEYFYQRAKETEIQDASGAVNETSFRYPGPKPQSREAGIMMLADAVESACRTLVDPAPARIESLVHELALSRLLDGQFDECGLTLKELHTVEQALVKSLTAVYHGRVKYPGKQQPRIVPQSVG